MSPVPSREVCAAAVDARTRRVAPACAGAAGGAPLRTTPRTPPRTRTSAGGCRPSSPRAGRGSPMEPSGGDCAKVYATACATPCYTGAGAGARAGTATTRSSRTERARAMRNPTLVLRRERTGGAALQANGTSIWRAPNRKLGTRLPSPGLGACTPHCASVDRGAPRALGRRGKGTGASPGEGARGTAPRGLRAGGGSPARVPPRVHHPSTQARRAAGAGVCGGAGGASPKAGAGPYAAKEARRRLRDGRDEAE